MTGVHSESEIAAEYPGEKYFDRALEFVIPHEQRAYDPPPGDPVPAGQHELSYADYSDFRRQHGIPVRDVRLVPPGELRRTVREHYWEPLHCASFEYPVALTLFDSAVHLGVGRVTVWLERVLGFVPDGGFGPMTLSAARIYATVHGDLALADALIGRRVSYYDHIASPGSPLSRFSPYWMQRVDELRAEIGLDPLPGR